MVRITAVLLHATNHELCVCLQGNLWCLLPAESSAERFGNRSDFFSKYNHFWGTVRDDPDVRSYRVSLGVCLHTQEFGKS